MSVKIPLLYDHHAHPLQSIGFDAAVKLHSVQTKEQALKILKTLDPEKISLVCGWNNRYFNFDEYELDGLAPLIICNISFHLFHINEPAKKRLKPEDLVVFDTSHNKIQQEKNMPRILTLIYKINPATNVGLLSYYDKLLALGIWQTDDMLLLSEEALINICNSSYAHRARFYATPDTYKLLTPSSQARIHGLKILADGSLGVYTAAMDGFYLNGDRGVLVYSEPEISAFLDQALHAGKELSIHTIGSLACKKIIEWINNRKQKDRSNPKVRLEHCQFISLEDARLAKELELTLCLQPNFSVDSVVYTDRLPAKILATNNPLRMLIDKAGFIPGQDLIFGSDTLPYGVKPALESSLFPPCPGQRLTLDEFVAGYCLSDMKQGYIDVSINEQNKSVDTKVVSL